jgi:hypothetical protein
MVNVVMARRVIDACGPSNKHIPANPTIAILGPIGMANSIRAIIKTKPRIAKKIGSI